MHVVAFGQTVGQSWTQIADLAIAFGLSALIGLERELKQKAAGIRTYTVVGVGTALFVLVSKYGFTDVINGSTVRLDPSRVAAQIVSGLGFIGGGIIFVKRDVVRGLTTAASIWMTAAIAAVAAADLPILAVAGAVAYFAAILVLPACTRLAARALGADRPALQITYVDRRGLLREILETITQTGFVVANLSTTYHRPTDQAVTLHLLLDGRGNLDTMMTIVSEIEGVLSVTSGAEPED
jgi:putative Mg2+ transporter-C (MgtC) family protein